MGQLLAGGEGKQRGNLEARISELGLNDKVLMPGYCNNVPSLQRKSDLLVMPSLTEGLPITLLEAMGVRIPVLVSPVGEMPAVLGHGEGGYLLPQDCDIRQLGTHILDVLNDGHRESKADWSFRKVARYYSVEAMQKNYGELYVTVLGDAP